MSRLLSPGWLLFGLAAAGLCVNLAFGCNTDDDVIRASPIQQTGGAAGTAGTAGTSGTAGVGVGGASGSAGTGGAAGTGGDPYAPIEAAIQAEMQKDPDIGAAVAILENGKLAWSKGFGRKDPIDPNSPSVTPSTLFMGVHLGMPMTSLAAMILVDQGKLSLDDPVQKHIPELTVKWNAEWMPDMKVRHLMSWSSGFPFMLTGWQGKEDDSLLEDYVTTYLC